MFLFRNIFLKKFSLRVKQNLLSVYRFKKMFMKKLDEDGA